MNLQGERKMNLQTNYSNKTIEFIPISKISFQFDNLHAKLHENTVLLFQEILFDCILLVKLQMTILKTPTMVTVDFCSALYSLRKNKKRALDIGAT